KVSDGEWREDEKKRGRVEDFADEFWKDRDRVAEMYEEVVGKLRSSETVRPLQRRPKTPAIPPRPKTALHPTEIQISQPTRPKTAPPSHHTYLVATSSGWHTGSDAHAFDHIESEETGLEFARQAYEKEGVGKGTKGREEVVSGVVSGRASPEGEGLVGVRMRMRRRSEEGVGSGVGAGAGERAGGERRGMQDMEASLGQLPDAEQSQAVDTEDEHPTSAEEGSVHTEGEQQPEVNEPIPPPPPEKKKKKRKTHRKKKRKRSSISAPPSDPSSTLPTPLASRRPTLRPRTASLAPQDGSEPLFEEEELIPELPQSTADELARLELERLRQIEEEERRKEEEERLRKEVELCSRPIEGHVEIVMRCMERVERGVVLIQALYRAHKIHTQYHRIIQILHQKRNPVLALKQLHNLDDAAFIPSTGEYLPPKPEESENVDEDDEVMDFNPVLNRSKRYARKRMGEPRDLQIGEDLKRKWEVWNRWKGHYKLYFADLMAEMKGRELDSLEVDLDSVDEVVVEEEPSNVESTAKSTPAFLHRRQSALDSIQPQRRLSTAPTSLENRRASMMPLDSSRRGSVMPRRGSEMGVLKSIKSKRGSMALGMASSKSPLEFAVEKLKGRVCVDFVVGVLDAVEGLKASLRE
ncbi:hypothetical protein HK097_003921, partial [Rhizophlyctis rosea]